VHPVSVLDAPRRLTAVVAETTTWDDYPALWPQLLDEVYEFVRPRPELAAPDAAGDRWRNVMLYRDDQPVVEVGVLVDVPFEAAGRVIASSLPAGSAAMTVHRGDYAGLGDAHDAVVRHARAHGHTLAGPRWEIYGHPPDVEIEIYYLLA
jgi:effector-binding domain-containing protein